MPELWLIRHGESLGNVDGSGADTELTDVGRQQAGLLRARLHSVGFDLVATSPLRRARETAALAYPAAPARIEPRLREFQTGPDASYLDTSSMSPEDLEALLSVATPRAEHETGRAFRSRIEEWLSGSRNFERVLAFTHYAVVREALTLLTTEAPPRDIGFTSVFVVAQVGATPTVVVRNDISHLEGA